MLAPTSCDLRLRHHASPNCRYRPASALRTIAFARSFPSSACSALTSGTRTWAWIFTRSMMGMSMLRLLRCVGSRVAPVLERDGEAHFGIGAIALAVHGLRAVLVGLVDPAEADVSILPRANVHARAAADRIQARLAADVGTPVEAAEIRLDRAQLVKHVLQRTRELRDGGIGSGPAFQSDADADPIEGVVGHARAQHEIVVAEGRAAAAADEQLRAALAEDARGFLRCRGRSECQSEDGGRSDFREWHEAK